MEARAYGFTGDLPAPTRRRSRRFWTRFIKAKAEVVQAPAAAAVVRVEIVPDEEFAHFEACMNNPQGQTPALMKGVELLRSLWPKSR